MKFAFVLRNSSDGSLKSGANVRLHPGTDTTKYSDDQGNGDTTVAASLFTDNGDGSYYKTITVSGQYSITVSGSAQDELTGVHITGDDLMTQQIMGEDFKLIAGKYVIKDQAITKTKINPGSGGTGEGLASDGLSQNSDGSVKALVDDDTIKIDSTSMAIKFNGFSLYSSHPSLVAANVGLVYHYNSGESASDGRAGFFGIVNKGGTITRVTLGDVTWGGTPPE